MRKITLFLISLAIWFILVFPLDIQNIILGIIISTIVVLLFGKDFFENYGKIWAVKRWFWYIIYFPVFTYYMILANLDVMYRVLHPKLPIKPGIVKVKTKLKSKSGRAALCNSITLTPGTLTVDIKDEYIYIHWINVETTDIDAASHAIVDKFEKILLKVFQ